MGNFGSQLECLVHLARKVWLGHLWLWLLEWEAVDHMGSWEGGRIDGAPMASSFLPQSGSSVYGLILPIFRVVLPTPVKHLWKSLTNNAQSCLLGKPSQVDKRD